MGEGPAACGNLAPRMAERKLTTCGNEWGGGAAPSYINVLVSLSTGGGTPSQPPPMKLPWKHAARVADSFTLLSCVFYFGHPSPAASAAATAEPKWLQLSSLTSKPNGKRRLFTVEQLRGTCTGSWSLLSTEGHTAASTGSRGVAPVCPVVTLGRAGQGWTVPSSAVLRNAHVGQQSSGRPHPCHACASA